MTGKSVAFITEEVLERMDDYESALRKHGIETAIGALSVLIETKDLAGAAVAGALGLVTGGTAGAAAMSGTVLFGKVVFEYGKRKIALADTNRKAAEIAFVHELKEKA
jgi:hypothetical protein